MKFRKKNVIIEAFRLGKDPLPDWFIEERNKNKVVTHSEGTGNPFKDPITYCEIRSSEFATITRVANRGDWIVKNEINVLVVYNDYDFHKEFENCEFATFTLMDFGDALRALKAGKKVAREGWNGKGMWLSLSTSDSGNISMGRTIPAAAFWSENNRKYAEEECGGFASVLPCITMRTASGEILMGWLASQSDMLANDWVIVP